MPTRLIRALLFGLILLLPGSIPVALGQAPPSVTTTATPSQVASSVRIEVVLDNGLVGGGSGTVVAVRHNRVLILTCAHLFTEGSQRVTVYARHNGASKPVPHGAKLVAMDPVGRDLAAVETEWFPGAVAFFPDPSPKPGTDVLGIGYPNSRYQTLTGTTSPGPYRWRGGDALGMTLEVRPGFSGGGVFDARTGHLLGVVVFWREMAGDPIHGGFVGGTDCRQFLLSTPATRSFFEVHNHHAR